MASTPSAATEDVSFRDLVGSLPADDGLHGLYPYPARLLRHIPRFLLAQDAVVRGVETIIDPFCGSGTVLIEGQRTGIRGIGFDQNPIAALVSRVKTSPPAPAQFEAAAQFVLETAQDRVARKPIDPSQVSGVVSRWVDPSALPLLVALKQSMDLHEVNVEIEAALQVLLALTMRSVARTDPRIPVPVRPKTNHVLVSPRDSWLSHLKRMRRRFESGRRSPEVQIYEADARSYSAWLRAAHCGPALVFTSPPYGTAQKYLRSTSLEHALLAGPDFAGTAQFQQSSVGRERLRRSEADALREWKAPQEIQIWLNRIAESSASRSEAYRAYFRDMQTVLHRVQNVPNSVIRMVLVTGTNHVAGIDLPTYKLLRVLAEEAGLSMIASFRDQIRGRALLTNRRSTGGPAAYEWVEVFEPHG